MQRVYQQTLSLATTAKACGCQAATVRKYRDMNKWAMPEEIEEAKKTAGRDITLTPDIAKRLAVGWQMRMDDNDLCYITGITYAQLRGWLNKNTEVSLVFNVTNEETGVVSKRMETIGLRTLREREWANFEFSTVQRLNYLSKEAVKKGDIRTAASIEEWKLEKKIPKIYGSGSGVNVNVNNNTVNQQNNYIKIETLNLDLETRKKILSAIKERELIEQENVKELE